MILRPLIRESCQLTDTDYTKSTEWALKNFELCGPIARSAKFGDHNAQSAGSRIKKSLVDTCVDLLLRHEMQMEVNTLQETYSYLHGPCRTTAENTLNKS